MFENMFPSLSDLPVPEGYERVMWDDAVPGEQVWMICMGPSDEQPVAVRGPFTVEHRHNLSMPGSGRPVVEYGERLLRKQHGQV